MSDFNVLFFYLFWRVGVGVVSWIRLDLMSQIGLGSECINGRTRGLQQQMWQISSQRPQVGLYLVWIVAS